MRVNKLISLFEIIVALKVLCLQTRRSCFIFNFLLKRHESVSYKQSKKLKCSSIALKGFNINS